MATPYLSELRLFSFSFAPQGWAFCNGQLLPINQNQALFSLLGTTYGGNGQTNFALPNMRGRVAIHEGSGHTLGEAAGASAVTITQQTMPQHLHFEQGTSANGSSPLPNGNVLAAANNLYTGAAALTNLLPASLTNVGGSQAHNNMMPYLVLNWCIALQGIFPSQN
jgi:microcystin-dependent protein